MRRWVFLQIGHLCDTNRNGNLAFLLRWMCCCCRNVEGCDDYTSHLSNPFLDITVDGRLYMRTKHVLSKTQVNLKILFRLSKESIAAIKTHVFITRLVACYGDRLNSRDRMVNTSRSNHFWNYFAIKCTLTNRSLGLYVPKKLLVPSWASSNS